MASSLAVCGGCTNSTYSVLGCPTSQCAEVPTSEPGIMVDYTENCVNNGSCNYALPSGSTMTLQNPKAFTNLSTAQLDAFNPLPIFQIGTTGSDHLYKSNQNSSLPGRLYIANGNLFGVPYNYAGSANPQLSNVECALWVCVETYRTTTNSTKQHQAVVSTYDQFFADSSYETNYHAIVPDVSSVGGQADFTIDQDSVYGLGSYLDNLFNDTVE